MASQEKEPIAGLKRLGWIALGAFATAGGIVAWFWLHGAAPALAEAVIVYNFAYSAKNLSAANAYRVFEFGNSALSWTPVLAYASLLWLRAIGRNATIGATAPGSTPVYLLLLIGWPLEVALTMLSGRALLHYYILWTPYIALFAAAIYSMLPSRVRERVTGARAFPSVPALILLLLVFTNGAALVGYRRIAGKLADRSGQIEARSAIASYISEATNPQDKVLVWGNDVWLNFLSDRSAPTRYVYQYPLFLPGYSTPGRVEAFLAELEEQPPVMIVEPIVDTDEILPLSPARRTASSSRLATPEGMESVFAFFCRHYALDRVFDGVLVFRLTSARDPGLGCT